MKKITFALSLLLLTACSQDREMDSTFQDTSEESKIDLSVEDITTTEDGDRVSLTVKNSGDDESKDFYFNIKIFKEDKLVGEFDKKVNSIDGNREATVETSFSGTEYDRGTVWVDSKEEVTESDEDNNSGEF
ncbi:MAG: CARDB domain-containing protein [Patescibacteria group bacterium]